MPAPGQRHVATRLNFQTSTLICLSLCVIILVLNTMRRWALVVLFALDLGDANEFNPWALPSRLPRAISFPIVVSDVNIIDYLSLQTSFNLGSTEEGRAASFHITQNTGGDQASNAIMFDSPEESGILEPSSGGNLQTPSSIGGLVLGEENCRIVSQDRFVGSLYRRAANRRIRCQVEVPRQLVGNVTFTVLYNQTDGTHVGYFRSWSSDSTIRIGAWTSPREGQTYVLQSTGDVGINEFEAGQNCREAENTDVVFGRPRSDIGRGAFARRDEVISLCGRQANRTYGIDGIRYSVSAG